MAASRNVSAASKHHISTLYSDTQYKLVSYTIGSIIWTRSIGLSIYIVQYTNRTVQYVIVQSITSVDFNSPQTYQNGLLQPIDYSLQLLLQYCTILVYMVQYNEHTMQPKHLQSLHTMHQLFKCIVVIDIPQSAAIGNGISYESQPMMVHCTAQFVEHRNVDHCS